MNSKRISAALATVLACALAGCSTVAQGPAPAALSVAQQPVERVNGVAITRADVERTVKNLLAQNRMSAQLPPQLMKQAEETALNQLTQAELLYQEARKADAKDLEKLEKLVDEKLAQGRARYTSEAEYDKALKEMGLTPAEMREALRKETVINRFIEEHFGAKQTVSEDEARKFYDQNAQRYFKKGERIRAHHILVGTDPKGSAEEKQKARERAEALLKRVKGGEDFEAIARTESSCVSAPRGGDLGVFGKGLMPADFEKAAYALKPGEVSSVVETEFGFHVIRLDEKIAPATDQFADVKEKILAYLKVEKIKKAVSAYLEELRSKAKIEKV